MYVTEIDHMCVERCGVSCCDGVAKCGGSHTQHVHQRVAIHQCYQNDLPLVADKLFLALEQEKKLSKSRFPDSSTCLHRPVLKPRGVPQYNNAELTAKYSKRRKPCVTLLSFDFPRYLVTFQVCALTFWRAHPLVRIGRE